jgi:hypothetical protein
LPLPAGCLVALALAGCAEGDLGRIKSSLVIDGVHDWVGTAAVTSAGGVPSRFPLTDDERELRDLAYPLIEAPFDRQRWYSILGEYGLNRVTSAPYDRTIYGQQLMLRPARSGATRYEWLIDDARNDLDRIGPFFRVAARVSDLDAKRAQSVPHIPDLAPEDLANAAARIAENQLVIGWVQHSLHQRVQSYRWALERLVVSYPSALAVEAERLINRLQREIGGLQLVAVTPPPRVHVSK